MPAQPGMPRSADIAPAAMIHPAQTSVALSLEQAGRAGLELLPEQPDRPARSGGSRPST